MSFRIFYFILFCTIISNSEVLASSGDCSYEISEYNGYGCTLSFLDSKDTSNFTDIGGDHVDGKADDDVTGVWIYREVYNADVPAFLCNKFKNLERIFFQKLALRELPENSFTGCKNLKDLTLKSHQFIKPHISKFPQNLLAGNPKLTAFQASLHDLRALPENFFSNNPNLNKVDLSENNIRTLPANIFKPLVNLNELILSKNNIHNLNPAWFEGHEKLHTIFINDNQISDIPKNTFTPLSNLKELWISFNHLKVINSDSFGLHPKLESINFMYNKITAIDEKFIDNIGIKHFQFFSNTCASDQFFDGKGEKGALKDGLKACFENYQSRVSVGGRVDALETEETTPAVSLFDKVDGQELLKNFLTLFNQLKDQMTTQSTPAEN